MNLRRLNKDSIKQVKSSFKNVRKLPDIGKNQNQSLRVWGKKRSLRVLWIFGRRTYELEKPVGKGQVKSSALEILDGFKSFL